MQSLFAFLSHQEDSMRRLKENNLQQISRCLGICVFNHCFLHRALDPQMIYIQKHPLIKGRVLLIQCKDLECNCPQGLNLE